MGGAVIKEEGKLVGRLYPGRLAEYPRVHAPTYQTRLCENVKNDSTGLRARRHREAGPSTPATIEGQLCGQRLLTGGARLLTSSGSMTTGTPNIVGTTVSK